MFTSKGRHEVPIDAKLSHTSTTLFNPGYLIAIAAIAIVYIVGIVLFGAIWRKRLVLSPEEEFALSKGLHGDPQVEGYDAMEGEVFTRGATTEADTKLVP